MACAIGLSRILREDRATKDGLLSVEQSSTVTIRKMTGRRPPLFGFPFIRAVRQRLDDGHSQTFRFIIMSNFERCVIATRESPLAMSRV